MGMTMGFVRISPNDLATAIADPEWLEEFLYDEDRYDGERTGEPDGYLDKAWAGIQFLLDAAEVLVDLRMDGDYLDDEAYVAAWDADLVARTAQLLRAAPFERLAPHFDPAKMMAEDLYPRIWERDDALGYLQACYEDLVGFFDAAAATGSAAIMQFG